MPVCRDAETARYAFMPRKGLWCHDTGGVVENEVDGVSAIVGVDGEGLVGRRVEAVEVVGVRWRVRVGGC